MKLQAEIDSKKYEVEINRDGRRVAATVDGRRYELDVSEPEPDVFLVKNENKVSEIFVSPKPNARNTFVVELNGHETEIDIIDPKKLRGSGKVDEDATGKAEIKTAMPGKVVRIIAPVGTTVQKGDGVIVVEAMKMQNEMKAPKDGVVTEIRAAEGSTVNAGDILAIIE